MYAMNGVFPAQQREQRFPFVALICGWIANERTDMCQVFFHLSGHTKPPYLWVDWIISVRRAPTPR
jgi:hypothetical protein